MEAIVAFDDNKITLPEINALLMLVLKMKGIDISGTWADIFVEVDGDLHIIVRKDLVDKLGISI